MSIQLSSAELVSRIVSDPMFANEIINYVNNIKPKLSTLASKTHVLEQIESAHELQIAEYKKMLKKLHSKYEKLAQQPTKSAEPDDCIDCIDYKTKLDKLNKEISQLKTSCESKDQIILNLEKNVQDLRQETCKGCQEKNIYIKDLTSKFDTLSEKFSDWQPKGSLCVGCVTKDEQIIKLTKTSYKSSKEKDSSIQKLLGQIKQMEQESEQKQTQLNELNSLVRAELAKTNTQNQTQNQTQSQTQDQNQSILNELYKQFGNFISNSR